jgi:hypothetical protein
VVSSIRALFQRRAPTTGALTPRTRANLSKLKSAGAMLALAARVAKANGDSLDTPTRDPALSRTGDGQPQGPGEEDGGGDVHQATADLLAKLSVHGDSVEMEMNNGTDAKPNDAEARTEVDGLGASGASGDSHTQLPERNEVPPPENGLEHAAVAKGDEGQRSPGHAKGTVAESAQPWAQPAVATGMCAFLQQQPEWVQGIARFLCAGACLPVPLLGDGSGT